MAGATILVFTGRFDTQSFSDFVRHRARRLSIEAGLGLVGRDRVEVSVSGDPALIDMFEMACSLGPIDCLVLDIRRMRAREPGTFDDGH